MMLIFVNLSVKKMLMEFNCLDFIHDDTTRHG
jgi:hypothetical protein